VHNAVGEAVPNVKSLTQNLTYIKQRLSAMDTFVMQLQTNSAEMIKEHTDQTDLLTNTNAYLEKKKEVKAEGTKTTLGNKHTEHFKHFNGSKELR